MLRVGIIGAGAIADAHISGYLEFAETCEIVAIADLTLTKAERKRDTHGLTGARVYDDALQMIADGGLDIVSITTPPAAHAPLSMAALRAGINVLVEKPMAPSLEDCDAMLAAQRESGKLLSVVAQNRFRDDMVVLKEAVDSGLLGPLSHLRVDSAWWRGLAYYDLWWRGTWESEGGGATLAQAIHHIDLTLWLLGRPDEAVAVLTNAQHDNSEVEDLSIAILRFGRALAQLTSSVVHHGEDQQIVVQGKHARVSQPWHVAADRAQPNGFPEPDGDHELIAKLNALQEEHVPLRHTGHTGQIGDVLAAVREGRTPAIDGADGRNAIEVVTAIYKAGIERQAIALPLDASDPYYRAGEIARRAPRFYEKRASVREQDGAITVGAAPTADAHL